MFPRPLTDSSDDQLVSAILGTDAAAAARASELLVRRFERPLLSLIYRMVRDRELAEDLCQEALLRAFENLHTYEPGRKLSSWLFKIAHNRTLDHLRRRQPRFVDLEPQGADGESFEVLETAPEESPDRHAEGADVARCVEVALGRLTPAYRETLLLRVQAGLAYQEIADVTGRTMATIKVQLHRARKQLARELVTLGVEPPEAFR